ncbi:hypothetical protein BK010_02565 [Tenericutes bacterium MO-XQ]|nr:hypothetical protein BK010_02565 [Tenericutes bacterium MO-XQ]
MKIIRFLDDQNYDQNDQLFKRTAVRAIIKKDDQYLMIQSLLYKDIKFPGGGQEQNESDIDTLYREVLEETGLTIIKDSVKPYGMIIEKRKSTFNDHEVFYMESKYYTCEIYDHIGEQRLSDYEITYDYQVIHISLDDAIMQNQSLLYKDTKNIPWVKRELTMLEYLKDET